MKKYRIRKYSAAWFAVAIWNKLPLAMLALAFCIMQHVDVLDGIYR